MKTVKQVAEDLTVSETIVYRLIESGELKAHRIGIGRGTIRVSDEQLKDYLEAVETGQDESFRCHRRGFDIFLHRHGR